MPFELNLEWTLRVDIHSRLQRILRLVVRPDQHAGWCFQIKGQYKPNTAQYALEDAKRRDTVPSIVGLHAAVKPWMDAQPTSRYDNCQCFPCITFVVTSSPAPGPPRCRMSQEAQRKHCQQ
jgi:hypothetical protein